MQKYLKKLLKLEGWKRKMYFVGILTKALEKFKIRPVVVGGHALEFYTLGGYATGDIDLVCPGLPKEIDNIFYTLYMQYMTQADADVFYPKGDSPCVILLPDNPQQRIELISEYVTPEGGMYGDEESILNPNNIDDLESLVRMQKAELDREEKEKVLFKQFGLKQGESDRFSV